MIGSKVSREPKAMNKGRTNHTTKIRVFWLRIYPYRKRSWKQMDQKFSEFREFRESDKSLKHELGSI